MILAWLSGAFIAGVALGEELSLPTLTTVILACVMAGFAVLLRRGRMAVPALVASAALLGVARAPHTHPPVAGDLAYYNGSQAQIVGVIGAEPDIRDTGANYEVTVSAATVHRKSISLGGSLWVHTSRAVELEYGDRVTLTGKLFVPQFSPFRGAASEMRFPKVADAGPTDTGLLGWVVPFRQHLENGIDRWLPEPEAALLIAVTLGARSASLGDLAPALVSTGLIHLIAISGIKVALVAGTAHELLRGLGDRLLALLSSLVVLSGYVLITGATISGIRSAIMWALIFIGAYLGRDTVALVSLALAATLMLAIDPRLVTDIGFQLSTVGTFYIVALTPVFRRWLQYLMSPFKEAFSTTVSAQIGTLPIVAAGFHVVATTGPATNTLALALLPVLIILGFLLGMLGSIPILAAPIAALAFVLLHGLVQLAEAFAALPGAVPSAGFSPVLVAAYYTFLSAAALALLRRSNWAPVGSMHHATREIVLALGAACVLLSGSLAIARGDSGTTLYWLGTGDAVVLRADGMTVLIGGSPKPLLLLRRLADLVPFDDRTIDLAIVTDPRSSTASTYEPLLLHYSVSEALDVGAQYPTQTYARWRTLLRRQRIPSYMLRTGSTVTLGRAHIQAIAPDGPCGVPQNCAAMLRITLGKRTVLLAGTAGVREQIEAIFRNVPIRAGVLVCPTKVCDPTFVRAVSPRVVYSVNRPRWTGRWKGLDTSSTQAIAHG